MTLIVSLLAFTEYNH